MKKTKEEIVEYLKENTDTLKELVSECNGYDGSLEDYYYWENDVEFFEVFYQNRLDELVRAVCYGNYDYTDDYVRINVYGNLDSCSEFKLEHKIKGNAEEIFDNWYELYKENNVSSDDNNLIEMVGK